MKASTDFEKISGYLTVLEEQQAIVTDMIAEMADAKNTAFDAILEAKASLELATHALKKQLAELDHIEAQKAHMHQVLSELDVIKQSTLRSLDERARQFTVLAQTVPNQIGQNVMEVLQHIDIAGAVRQRTDTQMDAIAVQVKVLTARSYQFSEDIQTAQYELKKRYEQLQNYFWWLVGGGLLAIVLVTAFSAKFFFGQATDRNFNAIKFTYNKVDKLGKQINMLESKLNKTPDNSEKTKKK
ncbi:hypothetical protein XBO1_410004 [Xenorhabdus bovienii str. oregonense]|uniref:Uncharacterized protein n=1 Tax=Xenorhabdus bovienii str. oregonense TaxID=1398202 RepID=A0A077NZC5_XENBV|nr:hypothetical protein [Xenorhabdus bovienii]CDH07597.1 hypothetical protein XBO1_410004 [Xenorhabdus bovienii str. oregonense]